MADPKVKIIIDADGADVIAEAKKVQKTAEKLGTDMRDAFQKGAGQSKEYLVDLSETAGRVFGTLTNPVVAIPAALGLAGKGLFDFGKASSQASATFEKSMANVSTLVDTSKVNMDELGKQVLQTALDFNRSPDLVADALYEWISANGRIDDGLIDFRESVKASVAGVTEAKVAVDGITTILNAYGKEAGGATRVSDLMFQTVNKGKIRFEELASQIGLVISTAKGANVPLTDLMAAIATATAQGVRPSSAMEGLRSAISNIIKPTDQAKTTAKLLGIQWGAAALQAKGLSGLLKDVREKTKGNVETMSQLFSDVSGLSVVLALTGEGAGMFSDNLLLMQDVAGSTDEAFQKQAETMVEQQKGIESLGVAIKTTFGDRINEHLKPAYKYLDENSPTILRHVGSLGDATGEFLAHPWTALDSIPGLFGDWAGATKRLVDAYTSLKDGDFLGFLKNVSLAAAEMAGTTPMGPVISGFELLNAKYPEWKGNLVNWFKSLPTELDVDVSGVKTWLGEKLPEWEKPFTTWTTNSESATAAWFRNLPTALSESVDTAKGWLDRTIPEWDAAFGSWLSSSETDVKSWFDSFGATARPSVDSALAWLQSKIPAEWTAPFRTWLGDVESDVSSYFSTLPSRVSNWISGAKSAASNLWDKLTGKDKASSGSESTPSLGTSTTPIPEFGVGAIVRQRMLAIVGEAGTEAIVPKNDAAAWLPLIAQWAGLATSIAAPALPALAGVAAAPGGSTINFGGITVLISAPPGTENPRVWGSSAADALYQRLSSMIKL